MDKKIIVLIIVIVLILFIIIKGINSKDSSKSNGEFGMENISVEQLEDTQSNSINYRVYDTTTNEVLMELTEEEKETINMLQYDPNYYMGDGIVEE